jgi:DNA/RNA endonuclease YhcR with UshA esterase domain
VLADGTGEIALILWADVLGDLDGHVDLRPGEWLDVQGVVANYRGQLEVIPELGSDVRAPRRAALSAAPKPTATPGTVAPVPMQIQAPTRTPSPALAASPTRASATAPIPTRAGTGTVPVAPDLPQTPTGLLSAVHLGRETTIRGQIVEAAQFASGVKSYVDDGSGPVAVWMPQPVYQSLDDGTGWRVGSLVRVTGRVDRYEDEIEVVLRSALDVAIVDAGAPLVGTIVPLGDLASRVGEWATVEAEVVAAEPFSKGVRFVLGDGSARITLLLWQNVYDVVPDRDQLVVGAIVRAMGKVQEYRGELELAPGLGIDVALVTRD